MQYRYILSMFNKKNRPFYNSCEIMRISRISQKDYDAFIQNAAQDKWAKPLPEVVIQKIFQLSEFHPSHINRICGYFWLSHEFPKLKTVEKYWREFVDSKRAEFTEDITSLSNNQKKVLAYLAHHPTAQP